jgi:hypothetical protein
MPGSTHTPDAQVLLADARSQLARLPALLTALTSDLDELTWRARPAADEWSPVEIVCHLRDEETEDFGARLAVVLAGGSEFAPIDPPRWAVERKYREAVPAEAIGALRTARGATLARLATIDPARLPRAVEHPRAGRLSGLDFLVAWVAHDRIHVAQLTATLTRLWADRWSPLRAEYAGPIPYAGDGRSG